MIKRNEDQFSKSFPCLRVRQPIGEFYVAAMDSQLLKKITYFDIRRIEQDRDFERYLGIQRPLKPERVKQIREYVKTVDACFPTAIILAVPGSCASFDPETSIMTLTNRVDEELPDSERVLAIEIAKVLDGQHRIAGLQEYSGPPFEINVTIFVDIDVAEQAYIFSTVNLTQTKVHKSLAYDLYELAKSRSPVRLCHNIAVALDAHKDSPFFKRIKRLGLATEGRDFETITQATFVGSLLRYVSDTPMQDRDIYMRGGTPRRAGALESEKVIFRNMMVDEKDNEICDVLWNYFDAVRRRWPAAWNATGRGQMLNKTNGFKGLMRFLRPAYLYYTKPGGVPTSAQFLTLLQKSVLTDEDFDVATFRPGSSGESALARTLIDQTSVSDQAD